MTVQTIINKAITRRGYGIKYNTIQLESQEDDNTFQVDGRAEYPKQTKTCHGYRIRYNTTQWESQEDDNTFQVDGRADYPKQSENVSRIRDQV